MFEICLDGQPEHVLAIVETPDEALEDISRIADATSAQLRANGEGHDQFLLVLAVWDMERGEVVARSGIRG